MEHEEFEFRVPDFLGLHSSTEERITKYINERITSDSFEQIGVTLDMVLQKLLSEAGF